MGWTYYNAEHYKNGTIDIFDLAAAKYGMTHGFKDEAARKAADVDGDGSVTVRDIVQIQKYLLGLIRNFQTV